MVSLLSEQLLIILPFTRRTLLVSLEPCQPVYSVCPSNVNISSYSMSLGERFGRKKALIIGVIIMSIGAVLQTSAFSVAQMIVARLITGKACERNDYRSLAHHDLIGFGNGFVLHVIIKRQRPILISQNQHRYCSGLAKRDIQALVAGKARRY
jgi:hypothetical protein